MGSEINEAINFYLDNGFVTECDFRFIGSRTIVKRLKSELEKEGIEYTYLAFEIENDFLYFIYNQSEFPVYAEMKKFITEYMEQRS